MSGVGPSKIEHCNHLLCLQSSSFPESPEEKKGQKPESSELSKDSVGAIQYFSDSESKDGYNADDGPNPLSDEQPSEPKTEPDPLPYDRVAALLE